MASTSKQLKLAIIAFLAIALLAFALHVKAQNSCSSVTLCATSPAMGGSLLAIGASVSTTATVQGAQVGMACVVQPSDGTDMIALGAIPTCTVTSTNTVTVRLIAILSLTPASKSYTIRVIS
jgi:hypothetical protein